MGLFPVYRADAIQREVTGDAHTPGLPVLYFIHLLATIPYADKYFLHYIFRFFFASHKFQCEAEELVLGSTRVWNDSRFIRWNSKARRQGNGDVTSGIYFFLKFSSCPQNTKKQPYRGRLFFWALRLYNLQATPNPASNDFLRKRSLGSGEVWISLCVVYSVKRNWTPALRRMRSFKL